MNSINKLLTLLLIAAVLFSCGEDDSTEVNPESNAVVLNPPPENASYYISRGTNGPEGPSVAWSLDLESWARWNNGLDIYSIDIQADEIIFYGYYNNENGIFKTEDGFRTVTKLSEIDHSVSDIIKRNGIILTIGNNEIYTSNDDGQSWTSQQFLEPINHKLYFLADQFVFFGLGNNNIYTSSDGLNWNVNNYGYEINAFVETNNGFMIIGQYSVFKLGSSLDQVLDTIDAFKQSGSGPEYINNPYYVLLDENNIEVFGTFYDSVGEYAVKGISQDGGLTWLYENTEIPRQENNSNYFGFPVQKDGFKKMNDNTYIASLWSNLRNNNVPYFSKDGGITWNRIQDESVYFEFDTPVYWIE